MGRLDARFTAIELEIRKISSEADVRKELAPFI